MENIILSTALNDRTLRGVIESTSQRISVRCQYCGDSALYIDDSQLCANIAERAEKIYSDNGGEIWWNHSYRWDAEGEIADFILDRAKEIAHQTDDLGVHVEAVPTWALYFLVNGDSDYLTDGEISLVKEWQTKKGYEIVSPIDEDEWFDSHPIFGKGSEVRLCYCTTPIKKQ